MEIKKQIFFLLPAEIGFESTKLIIANLLNGPDTYAAKKLHK